MLIKKFLPLVLILLFTSIGLAREPLPTGIFSISGMDENLPTTDLLPLKQMIGQSEVVSLGESIYTSGGYDQLRFRVTKFLVENAGFRTIAWEAPWASTEKLNDYITTCNGTAEEAVRTMFFRMDQRTTLVAMAKWLCTFNKSHPNDMVQFYGIDIQQPEYDYNAVKTFLQTAVPADSGQLLVNTGKCYLEYYDHNDIPTADPQKHGICTKSLTGIWTYVQTNRNRLVTDNSLEAVELFELSWIALRAYQDEIFYFNSDKIKSAEARAKAMVEAFQKLQDIYFPNTKTVLWAHNLHIAAKHEKIGPQNYDAYGIHLMGSYFAKSFGRKYFPIGLVGYQVEVNWPGLTPPPVATSPSSLEMTLNNLNENYLLASTSSSLFNPSQPYECNNGANVVTQFMPSEQFGALLFLHHSGPAEFVP